MTTIVNPLGTPSVTFNKSGTSIATFDASGTSLGSGISANLPSLPGETNVYLVTGGPGFYVILPSGLDVGTYVEIIADPSGSLSTMDFHSGESLVNFGAGNPSRVQFANSAQLRKVSATTWALLNVQ